MNDIDLTLMNDPTLPPVVMPACPIEKKLKGQRALVTGASSGIGKGIAIGLGHAGSDVVVNYAKDAAEAEATVDKVKQCGANSYAHRCDVSNEDDVRQMFDRMRREFGTIDILVNNAGLQQDAPFEEMTLAQWNKVIAVNSDRPVPLRPRGGSRVQALPRAACGVVLRRRDHLREFGARRDPVGRARQLRGL